MAPSRFPSFRVLFTVDDWLRLCNSVAGKAKERFLSVLLGLHHPEEGEKAQPGARQTC